MVKKDTQLGAYRLIQPIGQGGMGEVWIAEHVLLGRRAAIKLLRPNVSASDEMVTRFFNEARAAAAISDPGIVQIFDFGYHTDGSAYLVMELLEGETLDRRLERVGVMSIGDSLRSMRQVASSLGAAHARGIVHRDLKPENIFLVRDPEVPGGERAKILDFGIAKLVGDPFALVTKTDALIGTPMYMSPEQCRGGGEIDQRSDVYALGCVLFTLLVGRAPFVAAGSGEILALHLCAPPPRASGLARGIPPELDDLVLRCLAKDPDERFANAAELASAIDVLLSKELAVTPHVVRGAPALPATIAEQPAPTVIDPLLAEADAVTTLSASVVSIDTAPPLPTRFDRRIVIGLGAAALVAGVVIGLRGLGGDEPSTPPSSTESPVERPAPHANPDARTPAKAHDETERTTHQIIATLAAFSRWSATHAGAPCPSLDDLGGHRDPWGRPLAITCSDQPADQAIGVSSAGPDGIAGSRDDIQSWQLGPDVSEQVRGARWKPAIAKKPTPRRSPTKREPTRRDSTRPKPPSSFDGIELDGDGIPTQRGGA